MSRENVIKLILNELNDDDIIISTTGFTSRELFECREQMNQDHHNDFLTIGSMGHASQIALGIAMSTDRQVFCLDGDGSLIMHIDRKSVV